MVLPTKRDARVMLEALPGEPIAKPGHGETPQEKHNLGGDQHKEGIDDWGVRHDWHLGSQVLRENAHQQADNDRQPQMRLVVEHHVILRRGVEIIEQTPHPIAKGHGSGQYGHQQQVLGKRLNKRGYEQSASHQQQDSLQLFVG